MSKIEMKDILGLIKEMHEHNESVNELFKNVLDQIDGINKQIEEIGYEVDEIRDLTCCDSNC